MSDIVERLKHSAASYVSQKGNPQVALELEAVAEIERLRGDLERTGEIGGVCVGKSLGRRCGYCACEGRNLDDSPSDAQKPREPSQREGDRG